MIQHNMRLVLSIASAFRYRMQGLEFDDIVQEGVIGLNKAIDKFDPDRGFKFSTYATWWIKQHIQRAIANQGRTIRTPMHINDRRWRALRYMEDNPEAEDAEVAAHLGIEERQLRAALDAATVGTSLDRDFSSDSDGSSVLADVLVDPNSPDPLASLEENVRYEPLREALAQLTLDEREVLELRFGFFGPVRSINQIAEQLNKPGYVVSKLQKEGIRQLRVLAEAWYHDEEELN